MPRVQYPTWGVGQPRALRRFEHPDPSALRQMDFKVGWPRGPGRCNPLTILTDPFALCPRPSGMSQSAPRDRARASGDGRPALRAARLAAGGQWQPLGQLLGPSLHAADGLSAAVGQRRVSEPALPSPDARQGRALPRHPGVRPRRQPPRPDPDARQTTFDAGRHEFDEVRPHESPVLAVAASRSKSAPGPFPATCPRCPTAPTISSVAIKRAAGQCRVLLSQLCSPRHRRGAMSVGRDRVGTPLRRPRLRHAEEVTGPGSHQVASRAGRKIGEGYVDLATACEALLLGEKHDEEVSAISRACVSDL